MVASRSVRARLVLVVIATTMTALLIAATAMILYDMREYRQSLTADLATQADILGQSSVAALLFDDAEAARENLLTLKAKPNVIAGALYNARGVLFALYTRSEKSRFSTTFCATSRMASIGAVTVDSSQAHMSSEAMKLTASTPPTIAA